MIFDLLAATLSTLIKVLSRYPIFVENLKISPIPEVIQKAPSHTSREQVILYYYSAKTFLFIIDTRNVFVYYAVGYRVGR